MHYAEISLPFRRCMICHVFPLLPPVTSLLSFSSELVLFPWSVVRHARDSVPLHNDSLYTLPCQKHLKHPIINLADETPFIIAAVLAPCCLRFRMGKKESEKRVVQEEEEQEEDSAWRMCCSGDIRNLGSYMSDICTFVIVYNYRAAVVSGAVGAFRGSGPFWAWLGGKRNNNVIKKSLRKRWRASRSLGGKKVRSCIKHAPGIMWYYALVCLPLWDVAGHMRRQLRRRRRKHLVYF